MEELLYWIFEYIKVLLGYGFVLFVWPSIVLRKYLKGKSVTFRFAFCVTFQVMLINTVVLLLGLCHLLNEWTMRVLFYGTLLWSFREQLMPTRARRNKARYLLTGTYGMKNFILRCMQNISGLLKRAWSCFWKFYRAHWLEYTLLSIAIIYGMIYFSYGAFQDNFYGFGDMYVHHSWVYGLTQGQPFVDGVYPQALHCMLYSLHTLFGIDIYSCILFLAGIHIAVILLSAYCFMKEIFRWRFSAVFVLIFFLTVDLVCIDEVFSMSRLQWTLPQEYAFHTIYLCALYLILYLRSERKAIFRKKETKGYWDENLLVFMLALASSIAIHFYVTIIAFFLCFAIAVFVLKKIFNRKRFLPLVTAALCGLLIAFAPMGVALATGMEFQGSINWAVNVINGTNTSEGRAQYVQKTEEEEIEESTSSQDNLMQEEGSTENTQNELQGENQGSIVPQPTAPQPSAIEKIINKVTSLSKRLVELLKEKAVGTYWSGYVTLYKVERANWILLFTVIGSALWLCYKIIAVFLRRVLRMEKVDTKYFSGYLPIIFASILFMILYAAPFIGLPEIVAGSRLCSTAQMLVLMVLVLPIDMIFALLSKIRFVPKALLQGLSLAGAVGLVAMIWFSGSYHGYLYYEFTRYNAAVRITNEIINTLPENTYTIVSTTDEIYQVIQHGRHEELVTFLSEKEEDRYTLPTEYVFFYIEKKPLHYGHSHFFEGPDWLALEKYPEFYLVYSQCPDVLTSEISEEFAQKEMMEFANPSYAYSSLQSRTILESKAYKWCQEFQELYPHELKTYYEDDRFVCYYLQQNTQYLYDLEIQ